jgi:DNA-binding HxlR family transcriptional regulator
MLDKKEVLMAAKTAPIPMERDDLRSPCPVAYTLDILGDKWSMLVIRDLYHGKARFKEFAESPERIPTNILTNRLNKLVAAGVAEKSLYSLKPPRAEYHLTEKGKELLPILKAMLEWGIRHFPDREYLGHYLARQAQQETEAANKD